MLVVKILKLSAVILHLNFLMMFGEREFGEEVFMKIKVYVNIKNMFYFDDLLWLFVMMTLILSDDLRIL